MTLSFDVRILSDIRYPKGQNFVLHDVHSLPLHPRLRSVLAFKGLDDSKQNRNLGV